MTRRPSEADMIRLGLSPYPNYVPKYALIIRCIDKKNGPFKARDIKGLGYISINHRSHVLHILVKNGLLKRDTNTRNATYEKTGDWNTTKALKANCQKSHA